MASYEIGKLVWQITGDTSGIDKSLKNANKSAEETGKKFSGIGGIIAKAFAVGAVVMFGKTIAKAGSDAQETAQKFGVVFSSIQGDAQKAAKSLAQEFNFSNNAAMELLAGTGNLLEGLGYTQSEALKMSESIAQLGSDLTSMNNYAGGAAEATRILTKALLGEREALQALDIKVTDDQLRAYAKSLGTTWDALTQAEKAQATFNIISAQSVNAIGDVERSGDSAAFTWRKLENTWENVKEQLGKDLLPGLVYLGQTLLSTAQDSGPLLDAFGAIVRTASFVIKNIGILLNVLNSFKLSVSAISKESKSQAAGQELINQLTIYQAKYASEASAQNKKFIDVMKDRAKAGDKTAISELAYLEKLKSANADAADESKEATDKYIENATKIANSYSSETKSIKKETSERTTLRQEEAEAAKKQYIESQKFMGGGKNTAEKKSLDDLTQSQIDYGRTLTTRVQLESYIKKLEREATEAALSGESKKETAIRKSISALQDLSKQMERTWDDLTDQEKLEAVNQGFQTIGSGLISVIQSAQQLTQQLYQNRIDALDEQMQAELEAAGVSEETAVEKAQREYDTVQSEENRKALIKAQIEEKYQKKRKQLEYEAALAGWELQMGAAIIQAPMAVLNALTSGWAAAALNPTLAVWYPALLATLAGTAAGIQIGAVAEAKPSPPKFATGGIVPGTSFTGDNVAVQANSGEMILNAQQQAALFNMTNGGQLQSFRQVPAMSESALWSMIFKASQNGDLFIAESAVVNK